MSKPPLQQGDVCYIVTTYRHPAVSVISGPFTLGKPDKRTGNFRVSASGGVMQIMQFSADGWHRGRDSWGPSHKLLRHDDPDLFRAREESKYRRQVDTLGKLCDKKHFAYPHDLPLAGLAERLAEIAAEIEQFQALLAELSKEHEAAQAAARAAARAARDAKKQED